VFALPRGVDRCATVARQAFDARGVVEEDRTVRDGFDDRPVIVVTLQAEDDGSSRRTVQKCLHGFPEFGQIRVGDAAPGDLHIGNTLLTHHFIEDQQHLRVDDAADQ